MDKRLFTLVVYAVLLSSTQAIDCDLPFEDIGGRCLFVDSLISGSWYTMRHFCRRLGPFGGRLVKIDDADLLADIIRYIHYFGLNRCHYWIDASDEDGEGNWLQDDGTSVPMGPPFWGYDCASFVHRPRSDPSLNCGILDHDRHYLMTDTSCQGDVGELPYSPICEAADIVVE
ncbi:uncharacterized protein [Palaemon carinicauda]|uniref:uncharacterized protein n=1 Tax=Palaemon carinicauda TaxID=392227 RepID=UPI0035B67CEB